MAALDDETLEATKSVMNSEKSYKSSVIIMPPEEVWSQIQSIREIHDKAYKRWMPHINMTYPFIADVNEGKVYQEAAETIRKGLADLSPFKVSFCKQSFNYFVHRKNCTLWLKPLERTGSGNDPEEQTLPSSEQSSHPGVLQIQQRLEAMFPDYTDLSNIQGTGFQPHLSLGQFRSKDIKDIIKQFQANWTDIDFYVKEIYLISRQNYDDPFHIRHSVPLGADIVR